jgi:hypothetical protein
MSTPQFEAAERDNRWFKFAFTISFHYLFPQLTMGLALLIVVLTILNSAADSYGLQVALVWWTAGIVLAAEYFAYLFRSARGQVDVQADASS